MTRLAILSVTALLAACTPDVAQQAITLATNAMPCYLAVKAATSAADSQANILNGAAVVTTYPTCAAVDMASAHLIASAINAKAPVVAAAVSAPAK